MDVELFIYGVPNGEAFWGVEEDRNYFGLFYNNTDSDKTKFLVQTRLLNGKAYCYYNYLVYEDVVDFDFRSNSFFGISLRFDSYCKDVMNIYRVLDYVYSVHIVGKVLKYEKSKLRYADSSFSRISGLLEEIRNNTLRLLQETFSNECFISLSGFPTKSVGVAQKYNLCECSTDSVLAIMRQYGVIAMSPYYQSANDKAVLQQFKLRDEQTRQQCRQQIQNIQSECEKKLREAQNACEKERNEKETLRAESNSIINQHKDIISQKESEIGELRHKVTDMENTISRLKNRLNKQNGQHIESQNGTKTMQVQCEETSLSKIVVPIHTWLSNNQRLVWVVVVLLFVLIVFFCLFQIHGLRKNWTQSPASSITQTL